MPAWPFPPIPRNVIATVRAELPKLVRNVVEAVERESPAYRSVLSGPEGVGIRIGIEGAISAFLDGAEAGVHPSADAGELWQRLGESEFQAGRELEGLRAAFRTGSRALWREAAGVLAAAGMATELILAVAEGIFLYTDELAADVVEGYLRARSDEAGELERRRRRVIALLTDPGGVDLDALARAAALARWPVPRSIAALVPAAGSAGAVSRRIGADTLVGADGDGVFLLVPDPDGPGRRALLARALAGELGALGPTVETLAALRSLCWSRRLLDLIASGRVRGPWGYGPGADGLGPDPGAGRAPAGGLIAVEDHLGDLIVLGDADLADALVQRRLGPLAGLPAAERERLEETLAAWLAHQRHTPSVAAALHVHPQTVRYRIAKLRGLLGGALDDPGARLELEMALRARAGGPGA